MPASGLPTTDLDRETSASLRPVASGHVNGSVTASVAVAGGAGISSAGSGPSTEADTMSGADIAGAAVADVDALASVNVRTP
jgi:hypothetical protein